MTSIQRCPLNSLILIVLGLCISCQSPELPTSDESESVDEWTPTNVDLETLSIPDGMVFVPGGRTDIGAEDGLTHELPVFEAKVEPFLLDTHPVTVGQFREFVLATGYQTQAEGFGNSGVLLEKMGQWTLLDGANWEFPEGPNGDPASDDHPVTQVSWNDAVAYSKWAGKRLPTEIEWEHAARGAINSRQQYAWGDSLETGESYFANTWNGHFPTSNTQADGFRLTAPVGLFAKSPLGLTDMGGNVWEWTADWYRPYSERNSNFRPTPQSERAQRGGSFLCHESYCHGYRVSARSHSTPETSLYHLGFRCAKDIS